MLPGRLLGVAPRVGDGFCYHIFVCDPETGSWHATRPSVLTRSVVRMRTVEEHEPPTVSTEPVSGSLTFTRADGSPLDDCSESVNSDSTDDVF